MNIENIEDFNRKIKIIKQSHETKFEYSKYTPLSIAFFSVLIVVLVLATLKIWGMNHKEYPSTFGFPIFLGYFLVPLVTIPMIGASLMSLISLLEGCFRHNNKNKAYKDIQGENMEKYFNDIYMLYKNVESTDEDMLLLGHVVNTLANKENLEDGVLIMFTENLSSKVEQGKEKQKHEARKNSPNFFEMYKEKLENGESLPAKESYQFFNADK